MKHIRKIAGLMLSVAAALSMAVPAFASDYYSFTTDAPQDFYGSTSYEDVYGTEINFAKLEPKRQNRKYEKEHSRIL